MSAAKFKLSNIIVVVDNNAMQSGGHVNVVGGLYPLREKWEAFGWLVDEIDGHDMLQVITSLEKAAVRARKSVSNYLGVEKNSDLDKPQVIIAHTIKGGGVSFMEGDNSWHKRVPTDAEHQLAMSILGGLDLE